MSFCKYNIPYLNYIQYPLRNKAILHFYRNIIFIVYVSNQYIISIGYEMLYKQIISLEVLIESRILYQNRDGNIVGNKIKLYSVCTMFYRM